MFEAVRFGKFGSEPIDGAVEKVAAAFFEFAGEALAFFERHFWQRVFKKVRQPLSEFFEPFRRNGELEPDSRPKRHAVMADGRVFEGGNLRIEKNPVLYRMSQFLRSSKRHGNPRPNVKGAEGFLNRKIQHACEKGTFLKIFANTTARNAKDKGVKTNFPNVFFLTRPLIQLKLGLPQLTGLIIL